MAQLRVSTKRALITKSQSVIVLTTAAAAFVLIFTAFGVRALWSQAAYQNRVIGAKEEAVDQLKSNVQARDSLVATYKAFVNKSQNNIGGDPQGTGPKDGDNAKITLDALPSKYDFPALATSLDKIITSQGLQIQSISGTDDEVAQAEAGASEPEPVAMPFQISVSGTYQSMQGLIQTFNQSIRPFKLQTIQLSGGEGDMNMTLTAETYYQPEKTFDVTKKVVK